MDLYLLFDGILAITLLLITWQLLTVPDLFQAVKLFIIYGLIMAITYVRLSAPDLALAYLTIGTGLTGALLLDVLRDLNEDVSSKIHVRDD